MFKDLVIKKEKFPVVNFKLRNSGAGSAIIHNFIAEIVDVRLDTTPSFSGKLTLSPNRERVTLSSIEFEVQNVGWSDAERVKFSATLYVEETETFQDGRLPINSQTRERKKPAIDFDEISGRIASGGRTNLRINAQSLVNLIGPHERLRISKFQILASGMTNSGGVFQNSFDVYIDPEITLILDKSGLEYSWNMVAYHMGFPTSSYCVIIDDITKPSSKNYDFSRIIEPGSVDIFEVIVGAEKSCKATLKFHFGLEDREMISDKFELDINRPRNWDYRKSYVDGSVRVREIDDPLLRNNAIYKKLFRESQADDIPPPFRSIARS